jgi:hypothetical protein
MKNRDEGESSHRLKSDLNILTKMERKVCFVKKTAKGASGCNSVCFTWEIRPIMWIFAA